MKHITGADKSLLVGDEAATILLEYAAFLANRGMADTVEIESLTKTGERSSAIFLLNDGVSLVAESTHSDVEEPDNTVAVDYMREAMARGGVSRHAIAGDPGDFGTGSDD